jgi:hypothetical protein
MKRPTTPTASQLCNATGGSNVWATPRAFVAAQAARLGFDTFALDCAATRETRVCEDYLGPDHSEERARDALSPAAGPWQSLFDGPRFLNPPYSRQCLTCPDGIWKSKKPWRKPQFCAPRKHKSRTIDAWMQAAAREGARGDSPLVVLVPARTSESWFHRHVVGVAARVYLVAGRIRFCQLNANGELVEDRFAAPFPSMVIDYVPGHRGPTAFGTMDPSGRVLVEAVGPGAGALLVDGRAA